MQRSSNQVLHTIRKIKKNAIFSFIDALVYVNTFLFLGEGGGVEDIIRVRKRINVV